MKNYLTPFLVITVFMFAFTLFDGNPLFINFLKDKLQKYDQNMPDEKVYLQLDKPLYKPGDDIWFTAYVVDKQNKPSKTSDVVYVELLNPKGNQVEVKSLFCKNGTTPGDFQIDKNAPGGIYKIMAYTIWMKNFKHNKIFEKEIIVQKSVMPKLLMKLDFEKENYGAGETVEASFSIRDLEDKAIANHDFSFVAQLDGKSFLVDSSSTGHDGKSIIRFELPATLNTNDGLLNVLLDYKGVQESISRSIPIVLNKIKVSFFPEGGDAVVGVKGRIAFKALNEFDKPADIEGEIVDQDDKEVCAFKSFHMGMGSFYLQPEPGKKYFAKINHPKGVTEQFQLPDPLDKGYSFALGKKDKDHLEIQVYTPYDQKLYLVGQSKGNLCFSKEFKGKKGWNSIKIPTQDFPKGIAQFTLFDDKEVERCERLVFLNKEKKLNISITADNENYSLRNKVKIKINATDKKGIGVPAQISLAVVDDQVISFADDKQDNILSFLHLSSELKGKVEEPHFYFDEKETKSDFALDLVMMTHGWRRFTWKEVLNEDYKFTHYPERTGWISGKVINQKTKKPEKATVYLFEASVKKRASEVETDKDGSFLFINIDPMSIIYLAAQSKSSAEKNLQIVLENKVANYLPTAVKAAEIDENLIPEIIKEQVEVAKSKVKEEKRVANPNIVIALQEDIKQLSEIVVIGYGTNKRSDLTGCVAAYTNKELIIHPPNQNISQALQGRVAGLQINGQPAPGAISQVVIRGSSNLTKNSPIYVVDGFVMEHEDFLNLLSPNQIESISVLKSADATAIYGHRANNGVVVIRTKEDVDLRNHWGTMVKYARAEVAPREFDRVREFYVPDYKENQNPDFRTDFRETIYWNPTIVTDNNGRAEVSFYTSDATTTFRATVEGIGGDGLVGRTEFTFASKPPLSIDLKVPSYVSFEDTVKIPVWIKNNTNKEIKGQLKLRAGTRLNLINGNLNEVVLPPNHSTVSYFSAVVASIKGEEQLMLSFDGEGYSENVLKYIEVNPKGFPMEASYSGQELNQSISFNIGKPMPGSLKAELMVYPDIVGELMSGIESILRQPYGCFEQVSSSTYPNVLVLQYLKETNQNNKQVENKALAYISDGYKKLTAYETSEKGFEWFGHVPPHEGLTAYGVLEFTDMKSVYTDVNDQMLQRTLTWLLSRRDGKGGFKRNSKALDGFGRASDATSNAYIVFSLAEAGIKQILPEYNAAYNEALKSNDSYRLALMANAAYRLGRKDDGDVLMTKLREQVKKEGIGNLKAEQSITLSHGKSLQVETTSLLLLALLKESNLDLKLIKDNAKFLVNSRSYGGFGSTQATILALKALTEFTKATKTPKEDGLLKVFLDDRLIATRPYKANETGQIKINGIESFMKPGKQNFRIVFAETASAMPYSLNVSWSSYTPISSKDCSLELETNLSSPRAKVNETVRISINLTNKTEKGIPMTLAMVGIPSGLSLQPWQLKELQEKKVFDFYEIRGSYLVIYYRAMAPNELKTIHLDLKAEVPGIYEAPASSAFLYYTNEYKHWVNGEKVVIE